MAVVAVIINHFSANLLPSGNLGVDIFFVISGFVITSSLTALNSKSLGTFLLEFYSRRIRRLAPALIFCVVPTGFLICLFNPQPGVSLKTGLAALLGVSNLYLLRLRTNYFAESTELNVFTQTWSLGVEEQFYLLFPLLVFVTGFSRGKPGGGRKLFWVVALIAAGSLAAFIFLGGPLRTAPFFLMPTRFWELAAGCLLYLFLKSKSPGWIKARVNPLVPLTLLLATLFLPFTYSMPASLSAVCLTAILIANLRPQTSAYSFFTLPIIVNVGRISYSLYLWHWTIISLSRWTIGISGWTAPPQIALMLLLAFVSHRYVEAPLRYKKWSPFDSVSIGRGIGAVSVACLILVVFNSNSSFLSLDRRFPSELSLILKGSESWGKEKDSDCHVSHQITRERMEECLLPRTPRKLASDRRLYIFGDSHANQYVNALRTLLPESSVRSFTAGWMCGYISRKDIQAVGPPTFSCHEYVDLVDEFLDQYIASGDIVLIGHRWLEKKEFPHNVDILSSLAKMALRKNFFVILIDDVPELQVDNPLLCEIRPWRRAVASDCYKTMDRVIKDQRDFDTLRQDISAGNPHVFSLSLRTLYCAKNGLCGPTIEGVPTYADGSHLSEKASEIGAKAIVALISQINNNSNLGNSSVRKGVPSAK